MPPPQRRGNGTTGNSNLTNWDVEAPGLHYDDISSPHKGVHCVKEVRGDGQVRIIRINYLAVAKAPGNKLLTVNASAHEQVLVDCRSIVNDQNNAAPKTLSVSPIRKKCIRKREKSNKLLRTIIKFHQQERLNILFIRGIHAVFPGLMASIITDPAGDPNAVTKEGDAIQERLHAVCGKSRPRKRRVPIPDMDETPANQSTYRPDE